MVIIEKVSAADARELLEIYRPYVESSAVSFEYEVPSPEEFERRIREISVKYPYIKAVEDGKILGYAYAGTFKGRKAYDWSVETTVYVDETAHGRGIGRELYEKLESILKEMGILNMNACIAVPGLQDPYLTDGSIRFHEKMGFTEVGCFHDSGYKFGRWYDMIWMEKSLGDHGSDPGEVAFGRWAEAFS